MAKRTTRDNIVFTRPGAPTGSSGEYVQPRVRITRLGKPVKYADSLFRSQKRQPVALETADDFEAFFGSWATLRELVRENLAQIESTASEKEKWAASRGHRYASTTECRELTTEWFARQAKNHARLALKRIDSGNADDAVGFDVIHNAMIAVEQWGRMILSIHEPTILAERNIHTKRKTGGVFGAENQKRIMQANRALIEAAFNAMMTSQTNAPIVGEPRASQGRCEYPFQRSVTT